MGRYFDYFSLRDKNIIVTGACGLLGTEMCCAIAEVGGNLVLADLDAMKAQGLARQLEEDFRIKTMAIGLDISSEHSVNKMLDIMTGRFGHIDGLVNSAYPRNQAYGTLFENIELQNWRENVNLHLNGYFNVCQKVARVMMTQKSGNIINMASIYGILGPDFAIYKGTNMTMPAEYAAIKGGIVNFTRYMATYLSSYKIRVNCISAGGIYNGQSQSFVDNYCRRTPLERMGSPEDIAGGVLYLLSDLSQYVTGQNLIIDGGWSTW